MNLSIDYSNDPRWSICSEDHVKNGIVPNWFVSILYEYNERINNLKDINIAVETGTYQGQTTEYFANHFDTVHTVELNVQKDNHYAHQSDLMPIYESLHNKYPNINFWSGSSADVLPKIVSELKDERIVFLLDAHNGDISTTVVEELQAIKQTSNRNDHVILVDDCNCLGLRNWPTVNEFTDLLLDINSNYTIQNTGHGNSIYIAYE